MSWAAAVIAFLLVALIVQTARQQNAADAYRHTMDERNQYREKLSRQIAANAELLAKINRAREQLS
jgi:uncharacterized membrane-anchored protein YhcB (DUF1043 family)